MCRRILVGVCANARVCDSTVGLITFMREDDVLLNRKVVLKTGSGTRS